MFFSDEVGIKMTMFSPWHLLQIVLTFVVVYLIIRYRRQLKEYKYEHVLRYVIAGILLTFEISIHLWHIGNNTWDLKHMLPLDLCAINIYLSIYLIASKNEKLFYVIYFWGFGAVLSVFFPDIEFGPDRYRYYQFFFAHMMFWWIYMYMIFVHDYRPTLQHFVRSCIYLFILAIFIVLPINIWLGENYMFVVRGEGTPLEILEPLGQFLYTSLTVVVIFIVACIWYGPIYYYLRKSNKI